MRNSKIISKCRHIRDGMRKSILSRIPLDKGWIGNHIASCPRCQSRIASLGKVDLALNLIKSQTHSMDLLTRANAQTLQMLKHSLRECPKADKLRISAPRPNWAMRNSKHVSGLASAAACFAVIVLFKCGIFASMQSAKAQGEDTVKQYYSKHLDQETVDDIFSA